MFDAPMQYFQNMGLCASACNTGPGPGPDHSPTAHQALLADPLMKSDQSIRQQASSKV